MKINHYYWIGLLLLALLPSCTVIEGIFKAGVWTGIIVVVAVVGLIIWLLVSIGRRGK